MKKLLTLIVLFCTISMNAQESALLRLKYKKGDKFETVMTMTQDVGTTVSTDMTIKMSSDITDVKGDVYVNESRIHFMSMDMSQGGMNISYDSSKRDEELDETGKMMKAQLGPMMKAVITTKGNELGEVLETTVTPSIPNAGDFTNQSNNVIYPKKAVRVGGSWTMSKTDKGMTMDFVYTVAKITNAVVELEVSGKISGAATGNLKGNMNIDRTTGMPSTSKIVMDFDVMGQKASSTILLTVTKQ